MGDQPSETSTQNSARAGTPSITRIVIAGGGTAGWMTAAALSKFLPHHTITLVESDAIGTVGVGEATIPQLASFNALLGIDENEFLAATAGTFKLGIEFVDWGRLGTKYLHPFGSYGFDLQGVEFHQYWQRERAIGQGQPLDAYSLNAAAAYAGKFVKPDAAHGSILAQMGYAYHLDATLYGQFLRRYAQKRGVSRLEGRIVHVRQNGQTGFVTGLTLADGQMVDGDVFIDCTGFRALLIGEAMGVGLVDWSQYLPMNRAVAVPATSAGPPKPYTISTARAAGWRWRIPLQHRTGNGHVYCDAFTDTNTATDDLMQSLEGTPLAEPRHLRFQTGIREKLWCKNVVAIGLSGGFLEPLESTSIHMIQSGIAKLLALFPAGQFEPTETDEYNRILSVSFGHIRDFLIAHYCLTHRDDTPFWRAMAAMPIPDTLAHKLELLRTNGRFFRYDDELFSITSWLAVLDGQHHGPTGYAPAADHLSQDNLLQSLANMRAVIAKTAAAMPTHQAYIDRFCRTDIAPLTPTPQPLNPSDAAT